MKELYSHKVVTSFYLWFDHILLNNAQAFSNITGRLWPTEDYRASNTGQSYASPYKQWVYDSSVVGATIPSGIYINDNFVSRGEGALLDFDNGRVFVNSDPAISVISGEYSAKQFNTYVVSTEDTRLVYEGTFQPGSPYNTILESGVYPYGFTAPACFILNTSTDNKPWAFGGEQNTENKMRVIIVSDDIYMLDGCISVFRDASNSIIPLFSIGDSPFNEDGDLKSGSFNYSERAANQNRYIFIDKVSSLKSNSSQQSKDNPILRYAVLDFYLSEPRVPKLDL